MNVLGFIFTEQKLPNDFNEVKIPIIFKKQISGMDREISYTFYFCS